MMLRLLFLFALATPALAAPGPDAAADLRCAAFLARVGDVLEAEGHMTTVQMARDYQTRLLQRASGGEADSRRLVAALSGMPPVTLPVGDRVLAQVRECVARIGG